MKRGWALAAVSVCVMSGVAALVARQDRVSSGRTLTPAGSHTDVGSFPCNIVTSPDGRYFVVTDAGFREQLTVIDAASGQVTDRVDFNKGGHRNKEGLYYGLAFGGSREAPILYASNGERGTISRLSLSSDGKLTKAGPDFEVDASLITGPLAGIACDHARGQVFVAINGQTTTGDHHGEVVAFNEASGKMVYDVHVPAYPLDVEASHGKIFVGCERDGVVVAIKDGVPGSPIKTGGQPTRITESPDGRSLYVTNSGSDTISELDADRERVSRTILVRPTSLRGLPISTPLATAFSGGRIYVACGDLNAVDVVDASSGKSLGLIPTGWYPSAVTIHGDALYVASAKGVETLHPNGHDAGPKGAWGKYPPNIIEGTISKISLREALGRLQLLTAEVVKNDRLGLHPEPFQNPGIQHVIYIIKENRTYDQVFGDMRQGNGDPSLVMFGSKVTPNEHALAARFTLLDNFYDCAEISADGWNWSTSGMVSEYTARNVVNSYSGRRKGYDYEGGNNGIAPDLEGLGDVATAPGGYLWDNAARHHLTYRNYGFFVRGLKHPKGAPAQFEAMKKVLQGHTDENFPEFDLDMADSPLWTELHKSADEQVKAIGTFKEPSRFDEWKREFDHFVATKSLPALSLVRMPRDHTSGTAAGQWSPRAMVADNDYAIGKIVEAVSHSPYWTSTMICILEDDAQNGFDHVDCHRSTALVISPYMERSRVDHRFYNTDSMLRTMEAVLGLPPMNGFDATADMIRGLNRGAGNDEPYAAIIPDKEIAGEINSADAYRSSDSKRLIARTHEESRADLQLNDILWGALMGGAPKPPIQGAVTIDADGDGDGD